MKTRSFYATVSCSAVSELSKEQQAYVTEFRNRSFFIAEFENNRCGWTETDVEPRAFMQMAIKVSEILRHNPNEGVWVYGASDQDIVRVRAILGEHVVTADGNRVEGWR